MSERPAADTEPAAPVAEPPPAADDDDRPSRATRPAGSRRADRAGPPVRPPLSPAAQELLRAPEPVLLSADQLLAAEQAREEARRSAEQAREEARRAAAAARAAQGHAPLLNIANVLTVVRLLLVPVFLVLLLMDGGHHDGWRYLSALAFTVAGITDRFDGQLARSRNLVTPFGTLADPIADKALTGAALIGLSSIGNLPWWVTVVILARELGVTLLRFIVLRHGIIPASRGGKVKTALQSLALLLYLVPVTGVLGTIRAVVMALAVVITIVTGLDYIGRAARLRGDGHISPVAVAATVAAEKTGRLESP